MPILSNDIETPLVAEYLLLIEPRKDLSDSIISIKQAFYDNYKAQEAINSRPHLTIVKFSQYTSFESRIVQRLQSISSKAMPISIEMADFGCFPSHTIYINIVTKTAFQNLVKTVRIECQNVMKLDKDNKPHFILEPHITIARRLKPWQFEQGWLEYSNKNFSGRFIANEMILLKKEIGSKRYSLVQKFGFENIRANISQASLF